MAFQIPLDGRQYLIDAACNGATAYSTWYVGLVGNFTKADDDTLIDMVAVEITAYTAAQRVELPDDALGAGSSFVNLTTPVSFTFNASVTVYGWFITNQPIKSNSTGRLLVNGTLATAKSFVSGETYQITTGFAAANV